MSVRTIVNTATTVGVVAMLVGSSVTGGISLLGIPILLLVRYCRLSSYEAGNNRNLVTQQRSNNLMLPSTTPLFDINRNFDLPYYPSTPTVSIDPESILAGINPRLAASVLKSNHLASVHRDIVSSPVAIFASQGRGTRAVTRRRRSLFGEDIETFIEPL